MGIAAHARFDDPGVSFGDGLKIERVVDLYASRDALDVPSFYHEGERNPFEGRCAIVPKTAMFYTMVLAKDEGIVAAARMVMKKLAGRRKLREVRTNKDEVCYPGFAKASDVIVFWA